MIGRLMSLMAGLTLVAVMCCSCNSDAGANSATQPAKAPDASTLKQQGAGGVKARSGGGVAGLPEDAKPGEKVGAPPPGGKSAGG